MRIAAYGSLPHGCCLVWVANRRTTCCTFLERSGFNGTSNGLDSSGVNMSCKHTLACATHLGEKRQNKKEKTITLKLPQKHFQAVCSFRSDDVTIYFNPQGRHSTWRKGDSVPGLDPTTKVGKQGETSDTAKVRMAMFPLQLWKPHVWWLNEDCKQTKGKDTRFWNRCVYTSFLSSS